MRASQRQAYAIGHETRRFTALTSVRTARSCGPGAKKFPILVRESMHAKVVFRAAQIKGGAVALSQALDVPLSEVQAWMRSEAQIPEPVFARLLDMIVEDTLRTLMGNRPSADEISPHRARDDQARAGQQQ